MIIIIFSEREREVFLFNCFFFVVLFFCFSREYQ